MSDPKLTVFIIESEFSEPDTTLNPNDKIMIVPYKFIKQAMELSKTNANSYIYFIQNSWQVTTDKGEIPIEIEDKVIIQIEKENITSHNFYVTI